MIHGSEQVPRKWVPDIWDLIAPGSMWQVGRGGCVARPPGARGKPTLLRPGTVVLVHRFGRGESWVNVVADGDAFTIHPSQFTTYTKQEELFRIAG